MNSARGRSYTKSAGQWKIMLVDRCICPGGRAAIEVDNASRRARAAQERLRRPAESLREKALKRKTFATPAVVVSVVRVPDLEKGACRTAWGLKIADRMLDRPSAQATQQHRDMCSYCPVLLRCEEYVLAAEKPAGSWAGVWAGMSPRERRERRAS